MILKNKNEIINYLIDRKINSISYSGMDKLEKYIEEHLGVEIFENDDGRILMQIFIEVRNILVHNRGLVNRVFLNRVNDHSEFDFKEGEKSHLIFDKLVKLSNVCTQTALRLDEQIAKKFGIRRKRLSTWSQKRRPTKSD